MRTKRLTSTALMAALCCVIAPISIPIGAVPVSLSLLAIYITATLSGIGQGAAAVGIYIALGALGLPVFAGYTGGFERIAGMTGGFIIGYLPCALVIALITSGDKIPFWRYPVGMMLGTLVCYICGALWFSVVTQTGFRNAIAVSVLPFVPLDVIKIAAASLLCPRIKKALSSLK